jgi:phospholipid transport system substrate-binding protein
MATLCFGQAAAAMEPPDQLITQATENLVHELRTNGDTIKTTPQLAFELANKDIIPLTDFPTIARHVLGRHWRRASPEQREAFTHEFRTFMINLYVTAMVTYSQEIVSTADSFEYPPSRWQPGETSAIVRMGFKLKGAAPVEVGYAMHWKEGAWRIHDVQALGLSFIAIYRSNFASEIKQHGLDGLVRRLATKNMTGTYSVFANSPIPQLSE